MDKFILLLFPIIFMIHEFEEIIMIEKWMNKNRSDFDRRFPRIAQRMNKFIDYELGQALPKDFRGSLPTIEEIEKELESDRQ